VTDRPRPARNAGVSLAAGALGLLALAGGAPKPAAAQGGPAATAAASSNAPPAVSPAAPTSASSARPASPVGEARGVLVVAAGDATEETWPLAGAVYRDASLRPKGLRDETARVLAGEAPGQGAPASLRELSELRAAVRGDDAASRSVLSTLAQRAGASLLLVVFAPPGGPVSARPFDARSARFETWSLVPDTLAPPASRWALAPGELRRRDEAPGATAQAAVPATTPARAPQKAPPPAEKPRRWWSSPWLWGAVGVAAVLAGVVALTSRGGNDDPTSPPANIRVDR
jgi:hypothetical protein